MTTVKFIATNNKRITLDKRFMPSHERKTIQNSIFTTRDVFILGSNDLSTCSFCSKCLFRLNLFACLQRSIPHELPFAANLISYKLCFEMGLALLHQVSLEKGFLRRWSNKCRWWRHKRCIGRSSPLHVCSLRAELKPTATHSFLFPFSRDRMWKLQCIVLNI